MYSKKLIPILLIGACVLSACSSGANVSADKPRKINVSPAARMQIISECIRDINAERYLVREHLAKEMGVSVEKTPPLFCTRMVDGLISGKLSKESTRTGPRDYLSPEFRRVIRGG